MKGWLLSGENQRIFSKYCDDRTPITIVDADDPDYELDCIPVYLSGDEYCVIVDEDNNRYGLKRGDKVVGDLDDVGDVIIRNKVPEAQSA